MRTKNIYSVQNSGSNFLKLFKLHAGRPTRRQRGQQFGVPTLLNLHGRQAGLKHRLAIASLLPLILSGGDWRRMLSG